MKQSLLLLTSMLTITLCYGQTHPKPDKTKGSGTTADIKNAKPVTMSSTPIGATVQVAGSDTLYYFTEKQLVTLYSLINRGQQAVNRAPNFSDDARRQYAWDFHVLDSEAVRGQYSKWHPVPVKK